MPETPRDRANDGARNVDSTMNTMIGKYYQSEMDKRSGPQDFDIPVHPEGKESLLVAAPSEGAFWAKHSKLDASGIPLAADQGNLTAATQAIASGQAPRKGKHSKDYDPNYDIESASKMVCGSCGESDHATGKVNHLYNCPEAV
jgi:hypothetical protein